MHISGGSVISNYLQQLQRNEETAWLLEINSLEAGRGVQIVNTGPEHTFVLDEDALAELLLAEDTRERAVVVVSVAGAFRKGKSFLLDFFLRYMHAKYTLESSASDWLGKEHEPLQGFRWRGGSERDTIGLWLWSQPFKTTLANGEKVVVLLMDTQGAFDSESTVRDCATVFALSTMLSSVQIYNLSQNINEDDLQHLQLFTEYGRIAQQSISGKPFQKLQFLVRDWSVPYEFAYGAEGGRRLLEKRLEAHPGQHEELQALRRHIASCFADIDGFLMPHPGLKVATHEDFTGKLSDISKEFQDSLRELVPILLAPETLVPKRINDQTVKAKDLLLYFKAYMNIFNGSELPEPMSILKATAEANNLTAVSEARAVYDTLMEEVCGGRQPYVSARKLKEEHQRAEDKALHAFCARKKMGGPDMEELYRLQLLEILEEKYRQLQAHNEGKNMFRLLGTGVVFLLLMVLAVCVGKVGEVAGIQTVDTLGRLAAFCCFVVVALWVGARMFGIFRESVALLDQIAETIREFALRHVWHLVASRAVTAGETTNSKKHL